MRMWGTGLYESEYAYHLKIEVLQLLSLPFKVDELLEILGEEHPEANKPDDEMHPEYWIVIQDQFHTFGIRRTNIKERALRIIQDGPDLSAWGELDGGEANIRRRADVLKRLAKKWASLRKLPRKRRVVEDGGTFLLDVGDVVCVNYGPRMAERHLRGRARHDRWGAFIVLSRLRLYGFLPRYAVAQLNVDSEDAPPDLEACRASDIDNRLFRPHLAETDPTLKFVGKPLILPSIVKRLRERGETATPESARRLIRETTKIDAGPQVYLRQICLLVFFEAISEKRLERMQARVVGRLELDEERLRADFSLLTSPNRRHVEMGHLGFSFLLRCARSPEDVYVADFRWPIAQYIDTASQPTSL